MRAKTLLDARDGVAPIAGELGPYVTFDELACDVPEWARTQARIDPYYSNLWGGPGQATWTDKRTMAGYLKAGIADTQRIRRCTDPVNPHSIWHDKRSGEQTKDTVAALLMWRMMTADQCAAITGNKRWLGFTGGATPRSADRLVAAGMLRFGALPRIHGFVPPTLLTTGRMTSWDRLSEHLTFADWLSITAGQSVRVTAGSHIMRHNLAQTELGLRIAQFVPVAGVLGEGSAKHSTLVPNMMGHGLSHEKTDAAGDAVIATDDGRLLAMEMTVGTANADEKVRRWSKTLTYDRDQRVSVIFVVASSPGSERVGIKAIRKQVERELDRLRMQEGLDMRDRFFVVEWEQWFPAYNMVTSRFASLPVQQWNGHDYEWTDLIGPNRAWSPPTNDALDEAQASLGAISLLRGLPFWQRDEEIAALMRKRLGIVSVSHDFPKALPVMPYANGEASPAQRAGWLDPIGVFDELEDSE